MVLRSDLRSQGATVIAIVDDDPEFCDAMEVWLAELGYRILRFADGESLLAAVDGQDIKTVLLDLDLPGMSGLETLSAMRNQRPHLPIIMLTADESVSGIVQAMRGGACDYLTKPPGEEKLRVVLRNAVEKYELTIQLLHDPNQSNDSRYEGIIGASAAMRKLFRTMDRVAETEISVLIRGESGSGKELVARALHARGARRSGPFVAMNAAAVPDALFESELFGYEKGAFTGAGGRRTGKIEEADGGTLFLDEIAEIPLAIQAKLLRVIQERQFQRLGSGMPQVSDFRLIAATHRDLVEEVRCGRFREDLYFRIAVFDLEVPSLRERVSDIPLLTAAFVAQYRKGSACTVSHETMGLLKAHHWPGNVRELQNALQRAALLCDGLEILPEHLPSHLQRRAPGTQFTHGSIAGSTIEEIERRAMEDILLRSSGNVSEAMRSLKMGRNRFYRKLKKYGLMGSLEAIRHPR